MNQKKANRVLSWLLSCALLLSAVILPGSVSAAAQDSSEFVRDESYIPALGDSYTFTFGEGNQYTYQFGAAAEYKGGSIYPLQSTGAGAAVSYEKITDAATNTEYDTMAITGRGNINLVLLTADGTPFELDPNRKYQISYQLFTQVAPAWSQFWFSGLTPGFAVADSEVNPVGAQLSMDLDNDPTEGSTNKDAYTENGTEKAAAVKEGKMSWNVGYGSGSGIGYYGSVAFNGEGRYDSSVKVGNQSTYWNRVPSISLGYERFSFDREKGVYRADLEGFRYAGNWPNYTYTKLNKTYEYYPYLSLGISAGTQLKTADGTLLDYKINLISVTVTAIDPAVSVTFQSGENSLKRVIGSAGEELSLFIPEVPEGKYFTGWFTDPACRKVFGSAGITQHTETINNKNTTIKDQYYYQLPKSSTVLYAGFADYISANTSAVISESTAKRNPTIGYIGRGYLSSTFSYAHVYHNSGWSNVGWDESEQAIRFKNGNTWSQSGSYLLMNEKNNAFLAEPDTQYKIAVTYKIPSVADETGKPLVVLQVGYGLTTETMFDINARNNYFSFQNVKNKTWTATTEDYQTEEFLIDAKDASTVSFQEGSLPIFGIRATLNKSSCDKITDANGKETEKAREPGNQLLIRSVSIEKVGVTVRYHKLDGTIQASTLALGSALTQPAAATGCDYVYSLSSTELILPPDTIPSDPAKAKALDLYESKEPNRVGFENYNYLTTDGFSFGYYNYSISDEQAFSGRKSLKYTYTRELADQPYAWEKLTTEPADWATAYYTKYYTKNADKESYSLIEKQETPPSFEANLYYKVKSTYTVRRSQNENNVNLFANAKDNATYRVTFRYYVEKGNETDYSCQIITCGSNIWWAGSIKKYGSELTLSKEQADGQWHEGTFLFTTGALDVTNSDGKVYKDYRNISLLGWAKEDKQCILYMDDFKLEEITTAKFDLNGGSVDRGNAREAIAGGVKTIYTPVGEAIVPPQVYKINAELAGWADSTDESKTPVTSFEADKTYTAVWTENAVGFEAYPFLVDPENTAGYGIQSQIDWFYNYKYYTVEAEENGNHFLRFDSHKKARTDQEHIAPLFRNLEEGAAYQLTYRYQVENLEADVLVRPVSMSNSIWLLADRTIYQDAAYRITRDTQPGQWRDVTVYFTVNRAGNGRYLSLQTYLTKADTDCRILYDDFAITKLDENTGYAKYYDKYDHRVNAGWLTGELNTEIALENSDAAKNGRFFSSDQYATILTNPDLKYTTRKDAKVATVKSDPNLTENNVAFEVYDNAALYWGTVKYGDSDFDGKIDTNDVTNLKKILLEESEDAHGGADLNQDSRVDVMDLVMLRHMMVGENYQTVYENSQKANS